LIIKPRLKIFLQTLIFNFQSSFDCKIFIAIRIAIKKLIRMNRTLIGKFQPDFDFLFPVKP